MSEKTLIDASTLRSLSSEELLVKADECGVENTHVLRKQDLIFSIMKNMAKRGDNLKVSGVVETMPDGFAFLRFPESNYLSGADDIYVAPSFVRSQGLKTGDEVVCVVRRPKDSERYFSRKSAGS